MPKVLRYPDNPIFSPDKDSTWEAGAAFNPSIVKGDDKYHFVYRAISSPQIYYGNQMELSSIGYAGSLDGIHFSDRYLFISPEYKWEQFGVEDPRVSKVEGKYYIFYTALSEYPLTPAGIKIGVAITKDFKNIEAKHQVTHFNSKAMALFPEKVGGKLTAVLTANTDKPPAKIAIAQFEKEEDIWSKSYWESWLGEVDTHTVSLQRDDKDHVEVGAAPVKTEKGWLLIYCYIKNFLQPPSTFGIEAVLLDLENPTKIIGRTNEPLLVPQEEYELYGKSNNVIFPSGALVMGEKLYIYYGAADTTCCLATLNINELLDEMLGLKKEKKEKYLKKVKLERFKGNPIITPNPNNRWESQHIFNPAAIYEGGRVHLLYRAMDDKSVSSLGYASSPDGVQMDERLDKPVYVAREGFEKSKKLGYSGCEDPRLTKMEDKLYMCYTAYDGTDVTKAALTSISIADFLQKNWNWEKPVVMSDPGRSDKNTALLCEKIGGNYVFFHRVGGCIWLDYVEDLNFGKDRWLGGKLMLAPRATMWDSKKIGIAAPPIKTPQGWLMIYHGLSSFDDKYRLSAALLDLNKPEKVISQLEYPILEPEAEYENRGLRPGTVFSCGAVLIGEELFVYYGAADQVVGVATTRLDNLLKALTT